MLASGIKEDEHEIEYKDYEKWTVKELIDDLFKMPKHGDDPKIQCSPGKDTPLRTADKKLVISKLL